MKTATGTTPSKLSISIATAAAVFCVGGVGAAFAQSLPDTENGRYALSPVADGVLRLDTRSGAVSTCTKNGAGWACYAVPDERAALDIEIGRLQADNEKLKAQLAAREPTVTGKIDEPLPKTDSLKSPTPKTDAERKIDRCWGQLLRCGGDTLPHSISLE